MLARPKNSPRERGLWSSVTLRVAWELYAAGIQPSGRNLEQAREHALMSLPAKCTRVQAEELAGWATREFVLRMTTGRYSCPPPPAQKLMPRPSWRDQLIEALDPVGEVVLRLVYGDGMNLDAVERLTRVDRVILQGAREGVRHALREVLCDDGVELLLDIDALDALLCRVARTPSADCRGGLEVAVPETWKHAEHCPRCQRGVRMVRAGVLNPQELIAPENRAVRPRETASVLALHLHPDARHHRAQLMEHLAPGVLRADDDAVMVDLDRVDDHVSVLHFLAEQGTPRREHIRGALVRGSGRWLPAGIIGPLPRAALEATRSRTWGDIDGCGQLPETLPEPPTAARWWSAALVATLAALLAGLMALRNPEPEPSWPIQAHGSHVDGQLTVQFDTPDPAQLLVVAHTPNGLELLHQSQSPWDKGALGTGTGDYVVEAAAFHILVATSDTAFDGVDELFAASHGTPDPMGELIERVRVLHPDADVVVHPPLPER